VFPVDFSFFSLHIMARITRSSAIDISSLSQDELAKLAMRAKQQSDADQKLGVKSQSDIM
jgi:hypothetical protein